MNPPLKHIQGRTDWTIRLAEDRDAPGLAVLCTQLGYPVIHSQLKARLESILRLDHHALYVAVDHEGDLVGWIHLFERPLLIQAPGAELGGLVVEERSRGSGVGKALLLAAEQWAQAKGLTLVTVRSNTRRTAAHAFYQACGYELIKTSKTFKKEINPGE